MVLVMYTKCGFHKINYSRYSCNSLGGGAALRRKSGGGAILVLRSLNNTPA